MHSLAGVHHPYLCHQRSYTLPPGPLTARSFHRTTAAKTLQCLRLDSSVRRCCCRSIDIAGSGIIQAGANAGDGVSVNADVAAMQIDNEAGNQKAKIYPTKAIVKVSDGSLTVKQVKVEHERLVPDWKWVVEEINENSFATTFPSSAELKRMDDWGPVEARSAKAKLTISEKKDAEVYKSEIPKVWVQFHGLPSDLRNFPIIWAVGTILGATKMVDMKFTKRFGRPRLRVVVLSPKLIPDLVDVVIGDFVYELQFRLEIEEEENDLRLIDMDNQPGESGKKDDDLDILNKDPTPNAKESDSNKENTKKDKKDGSSSAPPAAKNSNKGTQAALLSRPTMELKSIGLFDSTKAWVLKSFDGPLNSKSPVQTPAENTTPTRWSKRNVAIGDQDSTERAAKLKACKNLEEPNNSDSADELDLLAINQLCGEIAEGTSEGEAIDLCDLQEPQPIDWEYYRKGIGSKVVDMYKEAYKKYKVHSHNRNGLCAVAFMDDHYLVLSAFSLLNMDPAEADKLMKIQRDLDETKIILHKTIESVLARGERLDSLVEKSSDLSAASQVAIIIYGSFKRKLSTCHLLYVSLSIQ
ncbi:unnamed protein product [Miscanthus lutarioriparius]|uniref:V-SNARE coiled-coil homology domain-containing protein n=1 Tax=Miscanthus lutarioriparius TaxID=422564 RepID=A0A811NDF0_9POAL|nr:unnamed protein product [Miscanthus lutarioriparius]